MKDVNVYGRNQISFVGTYLHKVFIVGANNDKPIRIKEINIRLDISV